jgi:class 3 adenylate cyclase
VGSTELAAKLDPEDLGDVMRSYQSRCTEVITRWGGHVAKYMGDGILAYFGYPKAHEDEAERAVRSGLAVVNAVGELDTPGAAPLAARVGIATRWSLANSSGRERHRKRPWSVRRRTSPPVFRTWLSRAQW